MPEVEVVVYRNGEEVERVVRPLREMPDGTPAVTYRRQLRPLVAGRELHLDGQVPERERPTRKDGWDARQAEVIFASADARLLVSAGPGTGKTEVAAARVAHLISTGSVPASRIWLISFTRTAVREMRARIASALADEGGVDAVKIATLDAHAWALHSGFDQAAEIAGAHEENIESVLGMMEKPEVLDYIAQVGHLVVDEAQDIVGVRAQLVAALIKSLPDCSGVTVFADEAQAIYGFADDPDGDGAPGFAPLLATLRVAEGFERHNLSKVFRTESPNLLHIFTTTRRRVLDGSAGQERLRKVREDVLAHADGTLPSAVLEQNICGREDLFVLFRRRMDALIASSYLADKGVNHRLRLPGLPTALDPWLGVCLHDYLDPRIRRNGFMDTWAARMAGTPLAEMNADEAWALLVEYAGDSETIVSMRRLRQVLARSQPPAPFASPDVGRSGPVIGTIHAAKGRESDSVHLMLPERFEGATDPDEEARVVFVGATRARRELKVGTIQTGRGKQTASGRIWRLAKVRGRVQVQFGTTRDIGFDGLASAASFSTADHVHAVQDVLRNLHGGPRRVSAESMSELDWVYRMRLHEEGRDLGFMSPVVNYDLFEIRREMRGAARAPLPRYINNLYTFGARTMVLPPDSPEAGALHEPWGRSGFLLAPLVVGFSVVPMSFGREE
jgi:hypothetical protein